MSNPKMVAVLVAGLALTLSVSAGAVAGSLITGAQIENGTVRSVDVKNKTLKVKDLSPQARAKLRGQTGATGPQGAPGVQGVQGPPGPLVSGYQIVVAADPGIVNGGLGQGEAWCPLGKKAVGGGAAFTGGTLLAGTTVGRSFPALAIRDGAGNVTGSAAPTDVLADGWIGAGRNNDGAPRDFRVWVICAQTG